MGRDNPKTESTLCTLQQHSDRATDEPVCPGSSSSSLSAASLFSTAGHHHELLFEPCNILEGWLGDDNWLDGPPNGATCVDEGSPPSPGNDLSGGPPPAPAQRRRGRKPGAQSNGPSLTHVEAERQRRDKLNRRFCELRAAVPTVSRMDKASLLSDAATYITQLRGRVSRLEAEKNKLAATSAAAATAVAPVAAAYSLGGQEKLEVRMVGGQEAAAALRLTTAARHAPARFMLALRSLELGVQHACVCRVGGMTVQDAVVDVPAGLRDERGLRAALLHRLQQTG